VATIVTPGTVVMIVDDDLEVRQSVAEILEIEGYEVAPVSSGEAALTALTLGATPSVVILDLWLPGMGSAEFARRLRGLSGPRLPLIVMTAWPSRDRLDLDADTVLAKPAEAAAIVRAVDKLAAVRRRSVKTPRAARAALRQAT
jgi:CheY-like chemotaxis protein